MPDTWCCNQHKNQHLQHNS